MPTLGPGDSAPDFELPIGPGETFKLSTTLQEGPVVLLTYIFDFSPGWTNELSEFGKRSDDFTALGARVCGISVDSIWAHAAWRQVLDLPDELLLLSDFNREFGERYGLLKDASGLKGILSREVLAIDRGGTIFYRWEPPAPRQLPKPDDVLAALRAHQLRG